MFRPIQMSALALCLFVSCVTTSKYQKRGTEKPIEPPQFTVPEFESSALDPSFDHAPQLDLEARSVETFRTPEKGHEATSDWKATVGVLEFNDEGVVNRAQYEQVTQRLQKIVDDPNSGGTLLVVFAHGWHHSCETCDRDIACFRQVIGRLGSDPAIRLHRPGSGYQKVYRNVVGLFLGWRGESMNGPLNFVTIYNRKMAAEHIGRTGVREVLTRLDEMWTDSQPSDHPIQMISVGHSLGGAMLFSAVKGKLSGDAHDILHKRLGFRVTRTEQPRAAAPPMKKALRARFGDLVVLVNPAIEAAEYEAFDEDLEGSRNHDLPDRGRSFQDSQLPIMITLASKADSAVGVIFPVAQTIAGLNVFSNASNLVKRSNRTGIGHYGPQITHELELGTEDPSTHRITTYTGRAKRTGDSAGCDCTKDWKPDSATPSLHDVGAHFVVDSAEPQDLTLTDATNKHSYTMRFRLTEDRLSRGWDVHSPYLVISTDSGVINEHSDIFNPVFVSFLEAYLGGMSIRGGELSQPVKKADAR